MAFCTLGRVDPSLPQAHRSQAVQMRDLRTMFRQVRSSRIAYETARSEAPEMRRRAVDVSGSDGRPVAMQCDTSGGELRCALPTKCWSAGVLECCICMYFCRGTYCMACRHADRMKGSQRAAVSRARRCPRHGNND